MFSVNENTHDLREFGEKGRFLFVLECSGFNVEVDCEKRLLLSIKLVVSLEPLPFFVHSGNRSLASEKETSKRASRISSRSSFSCLGT